MLTPVGQKCLKKLIKYLRVLKTFMNIQLKVTTKTTTNTVAKGKVTKPKQLINPP